MSRFDAIFVQLRDIMLEAAADQIVAHDRPSDLVIYRPSIDAKTGKPNWFGAVKIKKSYVAFHLMPLYYDPSLGAAMSDKLTKRQRGKSCFNFKTADADLFAELAVLARKAARV